MAMVQDIRVVLIKLADRTHNMRTLGSLRPDKRRRIARETTGNLQPPRPPSGYSSPENRAGRAGLRGAVPEPLSRDQGSGESRARQPQRDDSKNPLRDRRAADRSRHRLSRQRAGKTPLLHLPQDAPQRTAFPFHHGYLRVPGDRERGRYLLPRARQCTACTNRARGE